jgi:hypothetical protein
MDYGGTRQEWGCATTCDGMPGAQEAWSLGVNADGCPYWIEPEPTQPVCGSPSAECRAQEAAFPGGDCEDFAGYKFDGNTCVQVYCGCFGCDCIGADCDDLEPTLAACQERFSSCLAVTGCFPDADLGDINCGGFVWQGLDCVGATGCAAEKFSDRASCLTAHATCPASDDVAEFLDVCTQDSDCVLVDAHNCCTGQRRVVHRDYASLWGETESLWPPTTVSDCASVTCGLNQEMTAYCNPAQVTIDGFNRCAARPIEN